MDPSMVIVTDKSSSRNIFIFQAIEYANTINCMWERTV
jgi:hypothetical protein